MKAITTKDPITHTRRLSVEKTLSAVAALVSAGVGLAVAFGWLDPEAGTRITEGAGGAIDRIASSVVDLWPVLGMIGALWWRKRSQEDR